jgi:uncharacterized protein
MKKFAVALALLSSLSAHAGFQEAIQLYYAGKYEEALKEYQAIAAQGDARGEFGVAYMHHYGHGVPRNQPEAIKWFRLAASHGDVSARQYLAIMHHKGEGVEKDLVAAHMWYALFSRDAPNDRDRAYTKETVTKMERKMTPEEIARAKKMAAEWNPAS